VFNLFEKPTNMGTDERIVWESPDNKVPQDTSPDGRVLLYVNQDATTDDDLWALPLEGERQPFSILQNAAAEDQAQFSPDGKWIAYRSNESGRREIYVRPFPGPGSQKRVSEGGGIQPRWRSDGKELFYIRSDNQLIAVPIDLSAETKTLEAGKQTPLFEVRLGNPQNAQFGYDVAADGQSFIIDSAQGDPTSLPLMIVQNWKNALKK
jgi:Tol biopolymer transport system component